MKKRKIACKRKKKRTWGGREGFQGFVVVQKTGRKDKKKKKNNNNTLGAYINLYITFVERE